MRVSGQSLASVTMTVSDLHSVTMTVSDLHSVTMTVSDLHSVTMTVSDLHSVTMTVRDLHSVTMIMMTACAPGILHGLHGVCICVLCMRARVLCACVCYNHSNVCTRAAGIYSVNIASCNRHTYSRGGWRTCILKS